MSRLMKVRRRAPRQPGRREDDSVTLKHTAVPLQKSHSTSVATCKGPPPGALRALEVVGARI
jgi:hypothetical protein